jgi:signal transduction histidine kinase
MPAFKLRAPLSLAAQLISLLVIGLLLICAVLQLLGGKSTGSMHALSRDQLMMRYVATYQAMSYCVAGCQRQALLQALGTDDASFSLSDRTERSVDNTSDAQALYSDLATRLPAESQPSIHILRGQTHQQHDDSLRIDISARLPDGQTLKAQMWPIVRRAWWRPLFYEITTSIIPVILIVWFFSHRTLKPLRELVSASERLSRGERISPLPESGPRELRELAAAFNRMQERLARFINDRTRMIASMSHDFRTPITSLKLRAELIEDEALRSAMQRTLENMRQMVDETLNFAFEDKQREATREIDLATLLRDICKEQLTLGHSVRYSLPQRLSYRCRPLAMTRAITNLLNNAVCYGQQAYLHLQHDDMLRIFIDDAGPGLPEPWLERVFEPFARNQGQRLDHSEGVGLGLSIARSCIHAHGGEISLSNRPEGGLRVSIVLPT